MDRDGFQEWLDRYVDAWRTYDQEAIAALFSIDATYRYHPEDEPVRGRDAIVADWLESPDAAGSWRCRYTAYAIDQGRAVMQGWTEYVGADGETVDRRFYNVWLCAFDPDGRCTDFIEYYMEPRRQAGEARDEGEAA
jgi:hypothetical protein